MKNYIKRYYAIMFKYKHFGHFYYLLNLIKSKNFFRELLSMRNTMVNDLNFLEDCIFNQQEFNSYLCELTWQLELLQRNKKKRVNMKTFKIMEENEELNEEYKKWREEVIKKMIEEYKKWREEVIKKDRIFRG